MHQKSVLLLLAALLGGAMLWLAFGSAGDAAIPSVPEATDPAPDAPDGTPDSAAGSPVAVEAAADAAGAGGRDAVATHEALAPVPADAKWTELLIVDKENGEPIPGATVRWTDKTISDAAQEQKRTNSFDPTVWRDHERAAQRFGWRTTSDDRGIARVHRAESTVVCARFGDLYGHRRFDAGLVPPADGFRLELVLDLGFDVQVLDAEGQPAAEIPIGLSAQNGTQRFRRLVNWGALAVTRAPDGMARIAHLQEMQTQRGENVQHRACIVWLGLEDEGVLVDLASPPEKPVVLRLPPTGRMRVRAEMHGRPLDAEWYSLSARRNNNRMGMFSRGGRLSRRPDEDGWARFEHVALGAELEVGTWLRGSWISEQAKGPPSPDTEVEVVIRPDDRQIVLTGRLLMPDRSPARTTKVELRIDGDARHRATLETDENGKFLAMAGRVDKKNRATAIVFWVQLESERPLTAQASARELRAGTENLGDLVLALDALVVGGRCEIGGEPAKLPSSSGVQRLVLREGREPKWNRVRNLRTFTLEDGTFEIRGDCPEGKLRLVVGARRTSKVEPVKFARGQTDLLVELAKGSALAATILQPEGSPQQVEAILSATDGSEDPGSAALQNREDGRTQADWRNLPPGTYDLSLSIAGIAEPLHRVANVVAPPPPEGDPRLVDIDLRELLMIQEVRLVNPGNKDAWRLRGGRLFPLGQPTDKEMRGHMIWGSETKLLLPRGAVPMLASVDGFRPQEIICRGEPLDIVLDPWPKATILVRTGSDLPKGHSFRVRLSRPETTSKRRWRAQWGSGDVADLHGPPRVPATVRNGKAELQVGDDLLRVVLQLRYRRNTVTVDIPEIRANVTTPTLHIDVGDEALRQALEKLGKK